jgi:acyl-CoA thioesterase-1
MNPRTPTPVKRTACRTALLALIFSSALASGLSAQAPADHTLLFFGDSLTAGYGLADPGSQAFPAVIQRKIDAAHLPWHVVNSGLSGETSAGGLRRIDWVLNQKVDVLVLELGANDGLRGTSPSATEANLQAIIERVRSRYPSAVIVLAGMRLPPSMGPEYAAAFQSIYPDLAKRDGIPLIPFLLDGVAMMPELNQGDGIHPTASGAAIVADGVWKIIQPFLAPAK